MRGILKGSCPKCHQKEQSLGGTVRMSGNTHYICDPNLVDSETGRPGCNVQFYIQGIEPESQFEDKYIHFPFNVIFQMQGEGRENQTGTRGKHEFYRKPCIWTVPPNRVTAEEIDKEEQEKCRRGCPGPNEAPPRSCDRVHCPKNPAKIYCVDPVTMKPLDPPCTDFPDCDHPRVVPPDMWQCVWHVDNKCPDNFTIDPFSN